MIYTITNRSIIAAVIGVEEADVAPDAVLTVTCCRDLRGGAGVRYGDKNLAACSVWLKTFVSVLGQCTDMRATAQRRVAAAAKDIRRPCKKAAEYSARVQAEASEKIMRLLSRRKAALRLPMKEERPA